MTKYSSKYVPWLFIKNYFSIFIDNCFCINILHYPLLVQNLWTRKPHFNRWPHLYVVVIKIFLPSKRAHVDNTSRLLEICINLLKIFSFISLKFIGIHTHTPCSLCNSSEKHKVGDYKNIGSFSEVLQVYHEHTRYTILTEPPRRRGRHCTLF